MAVLLLPMSAIPDYQHHMTAAHGHSVPSSLSHNSANAANQPANKRPKLSLQTNSLTSTYGSLTRGIAPNTTAIYTPTTANTLSNTWDLSVRPSPISRTESPRPLLLVRPGPTLAQPYAYSLPFGLKPILKNSPLPPRAPSLSASPRDSRRRVFFPQPKRVSFRSNLEDQIETKHYISRHSDLTSSEGDETSEDEPQEESSCLSEDSNVTSGTSTYHTSPPPNRKRKIRRDSGIYIDNKTEPQTITPGPEDNTIIRPPPSCKRRKWQPTSSFGRSTEKEGAALKRSSNSDPNPESESLVLDDITRSESPQRSVGSDDQHAKKDDEEAQRTLSPFPTLQGTPDQDDSEKPLHETGKDDARGEAGGTSSQDR